MSKLTEEQREELVAYLDGELDEEATQALEARISLDPEMRQEVETMKQAWGMLDYLPKVEPSASFTNRTMEKLSLEGLRTAAETGKMPRKTTWTVQRALRWAGAVLLAAGVGYGISLTLRAGTPTAGEDEPLVRHLRVLERWKQLQHVDDLDFLKALEQPDLFGEDHGS